MANQRFCAILHRDGTNRNTDDLAQDAVDDMSNQMNNYQSIHSYSGYGPLEHNKGLKFTFSAIDGVDVYFKRFANSLEKAAEKGEINVEHGDVWICVDDGWWYGYGDSSGRHTLVIDGFQYDVWLGRALDMKGWRTNFLNGPFNDPHDITGLFIIHETAHAFGVNHAEGDYSVKGEPPERINTTPMGVSYVCNSPPQGSAGANSSTCFGGTGRAPRKYCHHGICDGTKWCYEDCSDSLCAHSSIMTGGSCDNWPSTKEKIKNRTPKG